MADCGGTSLKFNNLRIPIGTATQRRPWKYVSHPYPILLNESRVEPSLNIIEGELKTLIIVVKQDDIILTKSILPKDVSVVNLLRNTFQEEKEGTTGFALPNDVYIKGVLINNFQEEKNASTGNISANNITVKRVLITSFQYDKFGTTGNLVPENVSVTK